jgi:L-asparaginase
MLLASRMRIALLTTGGTVAMQASDKSASLGAPPPIVKMLERALPGVEVTLIPVLSRSSAGFSIAGIAAISYAAQGAAANHDGVVITHGTDVLEETAFALELITHTDTPIVLTGAMRLANQPSADGDANLITACRVARSEAARSKGVLVVFDDEIHWAPLVGKRHAFRTHAFSSEPFGPLGWVVEGRVRFTLKPEGRLPPFLGWPRDGGADPRSGSRAGARVSEGVAQM